LGVGRWALGVGRWALGVGRWALGVGRWALGVGRWALGKLDVLPPQRREGNYLLAICSSYLSPPDSHEIQP
jgi:hypothetical protein